MLVEAAEYKEDEIIVEEVPESPKPLEASVEVPSVREQAGNVERIEIRAPPKSKSKSHVL